MQPWVRILSIVAIAVVAGAVLTAGAPTVLAYTEGAPGNGKVVRAWEPGYGAVHLDRKRSNEGGPVELPRPIEKPTTLGFSGSGAQTVGDTGGKAGVPGAMATGRGASAAFDPAASAERSIQKVIRRLG